MGLDQPPRQGESETGSGLPLLVAPDLAELLEDAAEVLRGDADAGVGDRDVDPRSPKVRLDGDAPLGGRELDRVRRARL